MSFKFNYLQVTLEKQETQRTETSKVPRGEEHVVALGGLRQFKERMIWMVEGHLGKSGEMLNEHQCSGPQATHDSSHQYQLVQQYLENGIHIFYGPVSLDTVKSTKGCNQNFTNRELVFCIL